jgi:hypothetical protein
MASNVLTVKRLSVEPITAAGLLSLFDVLTVDQVNDWTGLSKTYIRHLCKAGQLRHVTKGGELGQGHGFLVMRKDFIDWWDRQQKGPDPLAEAMRSVAEAATRNPFAKGGRTSGTPREGKAQGNRPAKLR